MATDNRRTRERERVGGAYAEEHVLEDAGQGESSGEPEHHAHARQAPTLSDDQPENVGGVAPIAMRTPISCVRRSTE